MAHDFGKRQQCKKSILRNANGKPLSVVFTFRNGGVEELGLHEISQDMLVECAAHGIKQKAGDEGARESVTTAEEFQMAVRRMFERLIAGTAFERQASGGFTETDLAKALAEFKGIEVATATEFLKTLTAGQKAKLKVYDPIKTIIDRLMAERASASDEDEEDILAKLEV